MERRTLLERIGVVATTGVLVGCLDDGTASDGGPGAGGDGSQAGNGDGDSDGNGADGSDDGSASNGGGSDGDDSDAEGSDGTGDDGTTDSSGDGSDDENGDDDLEDADTENGENETVGAEEDSDFSARDGRSSVETTSADCFSDDEGDHGATVAFEDSRVVVTGHVEAPNPCHEATLEKATVRDGAVAIEIGLESTDDFCTECVGRIEYEATIDLADGVPDEVVVYHRSDDERTEVSTATQ